MVEREGARQPYTGGCYTASVARLTDRPAPDGADLERRLRCCPLAGHPGADEATETLVWGQP